MLEIIYGSKQTVSLANCDSKNFFIAKNFLRYPTEAREEIIGFAIREQKVDKLKEIADEWLRNCDPYESSPNQSMRIFDFIEEISLWEMHGVDKKWIKNFRLMSYQKICQQWCRSEIFINQIIKYDLTPQKIASLWKKDISDVNNEFIKALPCYIRYIKSLSKPPISAEEFCTLIPTWQLTFTQHDAEIIKKELDSLEYPKALVANCINYIDENTLFSA